MLAPYVENLKVIRDRELKIRDVLDICKRLRYQFVPPGKTLINYGK